MKYVIELRQIHYDDLTLHIDAEDEEEAREKAFELAEESDKWECDIDSTETKIERIEIEEDRKKRIEKGYNEFMEKYGDKK